MGSRGARRRRGRPRAEATERRSSELRDSPPPVMWPEAGSGFEADPFSPAGFAQQQWIVMSHAGGGRFTRIMMAIVAVVLAISLLAPFLYYLKFF